ncbi:MAG: hypothetical protein KIS83_04380 [Rubrivivax sp.]|nr:hypothetical protein [Rubrivivax sp.]
MAVAAGRVEAGRGLLRRAVALAEHQGARVDQARACEALAAAEPDAGGPETPARRAAALWQAMGVQAAAPLAGD